MLGHLVEQLNRNGKWLDNTCYQIVNIILTVKMRGRWICQNRIHTGDENHMGMCNNWFIGGYNTTKMSPYNSFTE